MRVLVLEAVCAGLCSDAPNLWREGAAMWRAVVDDLAVVPGVQVRTCLAEPLRHQLALPPGVDCFWSDQPAEWAAWWEDAVGEAGAVLVIAPETGGMLESLVSRVGQKSLNGTPAAIALCADKLRLAEHLIARDVPTLATRLVDWLQPFDARNCPAVIKPRDGAGGELTFLVRDIGGYHRAHRRYAEANATAITQPYCSGLAVSVAGIFRDAGCALFPVGEQDISWQGVMDSEFQYRGGRIPARITEAQAAAVHALVRQAAATIPGLHGYVGFDVILPRDSPTEPLLVEINPRLTTSYVGYRRLCEENLMAALLDSAAEPLMWHADVITFDNAGQVSNQPRL